MEFNSKIKKEIEAIAQRALGAKKNEIEKITVMKEGMTNQSFLIFYRGKKYILRIPGIGTNLLIDRKEEEAVYRSIVHRGICEHVVYINVENGCKLAEYFEDARVCNSQCKDDVQKCMEKLRTVHKMRLQVGHEFDLFKQIDFYESLLRKSGLSSQYKDYEETKENVIRFKRYIDRQVKDKVLTHIDAVPDNFLFVKNEKGVEEVRIIDWEYAGMQDPHVDIAMFGIYASYNRQQMEWLIETYFQTGCPDAVKMKVYCYIAACGLLWSNWCEYKSSMGVEFGEYALHQYQYAKEYCQVVKNEWEKKGKRALEGSDS